MNRKRRIGWVLAAAVAAVSTGSIPAMAQQRVGGDGRALDANNRIGSGGTNEGGNRGPANVTGNQIVTGNVTGGREFRGFVGYTDPFAFRGTTAGNSSDRFIRGSSGVPIHGSTINNNAQDVRPFFGKSQTVEPPPGFVTGTPETGFVPAPTLSRQPGDLRLGRPLEAQAIVLPQPGQLILPGPVDPNTQQPTVITASPLYGVRQWNFGEQSDQQFLEGLNEPGRTRSRLDDRTLQAMREELIRSEQQTDEAQTGQDTRDGRQPSERLDERLDKSVDSPDNDPLNKSDSINDRTANEPLSGSATTSLDLRNRLTLTERQDRQYAELRRRLVQYNRLPDSVADLEAHRQYNEKIRAAREKQQQAESTAQDKDKAGADPTKEQKPPTAAGGGEPSILEKIGLPDYAARSKEIREGAEKDTDPSARSQVPGSLRDQDLTAQIKPLQVTSLATGVQAKGLADFLREAEAMMKQGKFYAALDQYDLAEQVASNNPMVPLGRSIAELGAGYYGRAEQHLREAFTKDDALLMGQYDLKSFLGQERLEFLWNDLKAVAKAESKEPRPVFLLAFISYNTGNEKAAAAYLDLAEKRAGSGDTFYSMVRKHWSLPAAAPVGDDANK